MADRSWKQFERRIAKYFPNGRRRGADTQNVDRGGKSDIICDGWAPECALLGRPAFSRLLEKAVQSERNAEPGQIPVAIVKKKFSDDNDALVIFRLETFVEHFLTQPVEPDSPPCQSDPQSPGPMQTQALESRST